MAPRTRAERPNARGDYSQICKPGFVWGEYLDRQYDKRLMASAEGRRAIGRLDPFAWALIYQRHWLTGSGAEGITFSPFHAASYEWALSWRGYQLPFANRHAWIAPRGSAKTTLHFRILPQWSLCYLHKDYFAIFTRTSELANEHMLAIQTNRRENPLLRHDFPEFVTPRMTGKRAEYDTTAAYLAESGAIISAKGMDASVLGSSIDSRRANVIVLDDVENSEANYTPYQAGKRKKTITNAIGFYNVNAIWSWVGTTTMYNGLTHQLVRSVSGAPQDQNDEELDWIKEQRIIAHHFRPLIEDPETGEKVSSWPGRWRTEDLLAIAHTRMFRMEMDNMPSLGDEGMWQEEDFTYVEQASADNSRCALFVDPAVTATEESDYTGLCVSQYPWPTSEQMRRNDPGRVEILHIDRIKLIGRRRRDHIMRLLNRFPQIKRICVEDNQGGALWLEEFADLGVPVELLHAVESKEVRAGHALDKYQARPTQVVHVGKFAQAEGNMCSFPMVAHDDDVDAVTYGVLYWLSPAEVRKPGAGVSRGPHEAATAQYA